MNNAVKTIFPTIFLGAALIGVARAAPGDGAPADLAIVRSPPIAAPAAPPAFLPPGIVEDAGNNRSDRYVDPTNTSALALTCTPPLNHSESNPIVRIYVNAVFDADNDHSVVELDVSHEAYYRETYNREEHYDEEQYDMENYYHLRGHKEWWRYGTLKRAHSVHMAGRLWHNNSGWWYAEGLDDNGRFEIGTLASQCTETTID